MFYFNIRNILYDEAQHIFSSNMTFLFLGFNFFMVFKFKVIPRDESLSEAKNEVKKSADKVFFGVVK